MPKYRVRWDYRGRDWNGHEVRLRKDEVLEMGYDLATWLLAECPGMLHELGGAEQQERLIEWPPEDRMIRQARNR